MRFAWVWATATVLWLAQSAGAGDLEGLSWLAGGWRAEMGGVVIEEHWIPSSGGMMLGVSSSVAGSKAVGFEFLRIEARDDGVFYVAQPNGRPGTEFTLTEQTSDSVRFDNPEHDHPKIIRYHLRADGGLTAAIEGDEGSQEFEFQRISTP